MPEHAIQLTRLGKMYRLYRRSSDKVLNALGLDGLCFWRRHPYQEFWALRELDLCIRKGERVGIIGRNGAGKSTLLKIICGNVTPTEGVLDVRGNIQALMELGTGFHPEFNGRENIRASLAYHGLRSKEIRRKEEEIVEFAELEEFIDQPIRTYSAGMYARLAFATATSIEPDILIIDEVLGAGDAYFAGKCIERMRQLTEKSGATVLFVSHDLGSIQGLCTRAIWVDRGRIQCDGEPLDVIKKYSAVVRKEQEQRLRARDMKVLKKQAASLDRYEDLYDRLLMHFVAPGGNPPRQNQRIYHLRLKCRDEEIAAIDVGSPMDNSPEYLNFLMDTPGYMDWGPPLKDSYGSYREYGNFKGKFNHAPFEFAIPKSYTEDQGEFRLDIEYAATEPISVEVFSEGSYIRQGVLEPSDHAVVRIPCTPTPRTMDEGIPQNKDISSFADVPSKKETDGHSMRNPTKSETDPNSQYGSLEMRITTVRLLDETGREARVLTSRKPVEIVMEYESSRPVFNPIFVFCVYLADGRCAVQWFISSRELGVDCIEGKGNVTFRANCLHLGQAAYIASAGIFKHLRSDGVEAESYHVLDRCIHFQVVQNSSDNIPRGLCYQPVDIELNHEAN